MKISGPRHIAREYALRILYESDILSELDVKPLPPVPNWWGNHDRLKVSRQAEKFALQLTSNVKEYTEQFDHLIGEHAHRWRLTRMSPVDRNILRIGVCELLNYPETPARVILNEALELAKCYGDAESARFINGILDPLAQKIRGTNDLADTASRIHEESRNDILP